MFMLPLDEATPQPDLATKLKQAEATIAALQQELIKAERAFVDAQLAATTARRGLVMAVSWPAPVKPPQRTPFVPADQYEGREQFVRGWNSCLGACQNAVYARERVNWPNGSDRTVVKALRYLASNPKPVGGQEQFNAEHLLQLASELENVVKQTTL